MLLRQKIKRSYKSLIINTCVLCGFSATENMKSAECNSANAGLHAAEVWGSISAVLPGAQFCCSKELFFLDFLSSR